MKVKPLFKNFGSKWQSAKHYPGPNGLPIVEPFAGGAGYSLNHCDSPVTIWEANSNLVALWHWLINEATSEEILSIPVGLPIGTHIFDAPETQHLSTGGKLLLKTWQRTNNHGNCWTISKWGALSGQWTCNTRARVAEQVHAIKHWKLEMPNWTDVATYFIDPPYQYNYRYGFKDFDYATLIHNVYQLPAGCQVIACEARCPKTGVTPDYLPFVESHRSVTSRRKATQSHHSKELIYHAFV